MIKGEVLDTSVFVHKPTCVFDFEDNVVIIPFGVLEELNDLKDSKRAAAPYAQAANRVLDGLREKGDLSKGVATPGGGVIVVDSESYSPTDLIIRPDTVNNAIICTARKWQQRVSGPRRKGWKRGLVERITERFPIREVRVVSKDFSLRVKSVSCGVPADDYRHDKLVKSVDEIYSGLTTIPIAPGNFREFSRLLCGSGFGGVSQEDFDGLVSFPPLFPNQCCIFEAEPGKSVLAIYKNDGKQTPSFVHVPKAQSGRGVQPRNIGQSFALALLRDPSVSLVTLSGIAGSGKTLMALLAALESLVAGTHSELLVYRPNIELGEKLGYLPGTQDEKMDPWKRPILDNLELLANGGELAPGDAKPKKTFFNIKGLMNEQRIGIEPINFIQGRSLHYKIVIVDEAQNFRANEIAIVVARAGKGTKVVLTGDLQQIADDYLDAASNGLTHVIQGMKGEPIFGHIALIGSERSELAELAAKRL